ncbi:MAG TPA: hypothetical protein VNZ50_07425 [Hyphomicrobiaceae bacterium]|jgi:hypothetical protein|nr:hypothetical protein [Hyphomicrobiaceae bacterium]
MNCEDGHLPAGSGAPQWHSACRAFAATRVVSALWLLLTLLALHWAAPPGQSVATASFAQGAIGGVSFGANQPSSKPALQQRLLALSVEAEVRRFAGKRDPATSHAPPMGLAPSAAWRPEARGAAHHLTEPTRYRLTAPRYFEARGPPHIA